MEVIEQLEYALLEALNYVDELPILPPNPTPDTVDRFSMMRQLFDDLYAEARFKGYAPAHRQGRATRWSPTSSQLEEELPSPQNSQQQPPTPNTDKEKTDKVSALVKSFLDQQGSKHLEPFDVFQLLSTPPTQIRRAQELEAMKRVFAGILWADRDTWAILFQEFTLNEPIYYDDHYQASASCDLEIDVLTRLQKRHTLIGTYTNDITSKRILHNIFIKIDWIRFAEDYNSLSSRQKTAWLADAFQCERKDVFDGMSAAGRAAEMVTMDAEYKQWKKKVGKDTTSRNRLYELFLAYGAIVILDPVWNVQALRDHAGADVHKALLRVPARLITNGRPHPLSVLQPSIEHALVCIVEQIAGDDAGTYVNDFLDAFAPQFQIPRMEGYA